MNFSITGQEKWDLLMISSLSGLLLCAFSYKSTICSTEEEEERTIVIVYL
jgi:hypothetical protein